MDDPIWQALSTDARRTVDEHLAASRPVHAIKAIRDASPDPVPGLPARMDVITVRRVELGLDGRGPTPPADSAGLVAMAGALPERVESIRAEWDGDTFGWCVGLRAVTAGHSGGYVLATIRHGGDIRIFNGEVPPWPEEVEVESVGREVAARLGVPFHFAREGGPGRPATG
ncbi:hypothetical protein ACGF12_12275 [Kitasatospora sp. NPDC048296]|uniref:hypothetical protein n=1 Tax=Kitasatospora sp. NPDC048296 TaxID=3364048 RepID=UPI00371179F8